MSLESWIPRMPRAAARALIACLTLCALLSLPREVLSADSLSDAAKETAKPPEKQRVLEAEPRNGSDSGPAIAVYVGGSGSSYDYDPETASPWEMSFFKHWRVAGVVTGSTLASADFAPSALYGIQVGVEPWRKTRLEMLGVGGRARFADGSDMERLLRSPTEYGVGLAVRHTLGDPYALPGFAPIVGFRVGQLSWRYLQGILIDRDGTIEQVSHDAVTYYAGYAGLGTTFVRTGHLEVGVTAVA
ncbi:MAG TPA: hypothetical protein VJY35_11920, partial [Candidatus Eisenbacteria bacterium]|nr:hypothetical protein [Candidatus Eisenbacteria bacterium]